MVKQYKVISLFITPPLDAHNFKHTTLDEVFLLNICRKKSKLEKTSTQNAKEHDSLENITNRMLHVKLFALKNFVMREVSKTNRKIWEIS